MILNRNHLDKVIEVEENLQTLTCFLILSNTWIMLINTLMVLTKKNAKDKLKVLTGKEPDHLTFLSVKLHKHFRKLTKKPMKEKKNSSLMMINYIICLNLNISSNKSNHTILDLSKINPTNKCTIISNKCKITHPSITKWLKWDKILAKLLCLI